MSGGEIALIVLVALLLFGAKGLPEIARVLGKTLREVRKATEDIKREINQETGVLNDIRDIKGEVQNVGQNFGKQIFASEKEPFSAQADAISPPVHTENSVNEDPYGLDEKRDQSVPDKTIKASEVISSRKK